MQLVVGISLELTFKLFFYLGRSNTKTSSRVWLLDNHYELVSNIFQHLY